jgi:segregation and condensation protein B
MTLNPERLDQIVLALLFASEEPLSARKLANIVEDDVSTDDINTAVNRLTGFLLENTPCIRVERVAGGFQLATNTDFAEYVSRLYSGRRKQRLSKAALETLAIIAYKQPITRIEMESIRGVNCGGVITTLMERSLIRITGKAKVLGAPFLYATTQEFLEYLGLNSLKDLPSMEDLEEMLAREVSEESEDDDEGEGHNQGGTGSAKVDGFDGPGNRDEDGGDEGGERTDEKHEQQPATAPGAPAPSEAAREDTTAEVKLDD